MVLGAAVRWFFVAAAILSQSAFAADQDFVLPVGNNEIKIMSYNVQNLFDTSHDKDKQDFEFLPVTHPMKKKCEETGRYAKACLELDWTDEKVDLKLKQIKEVVDAQGALPDVLVLMEVENKKVVGALAKKLGYDQFEMTTSPDKRGIDCAILYRTRKLTLEHFYESEVTSAHFPTRNLSAAVFELDASLGGGKLAVFPNHWPSQGSKTPARIAVVKELQYFIEEVRAEYKGNSPAVVLAGDFNTLESEKPNPIDDALLDRGAKLPLFDVHTLAKTAGSPALDRMPRATYYYGVDNAWNEFDRFFVSSDLKDGSGLDVDPHSFRIHAPEFLTKTENGQTVPFRYNHKTDKKEWLGYSDHFGVVVKLRAGKSK